MDEKLKEPFTDIETAAIAVGSHITPYQEWPESPSSYHPFLLP
jgi:hypothetical protein